MHAAYYFLTKVLQCWRVVATFFFFCCTREADMEHVVAREPWSIEGAMLIVDYWRLNIPLEQIVVAKFAVWVRFFGLPLECLT